MSKWYSTLEQLMADDRRQPLDRALIAGDQGVPRSPAGRDQRQPSSLTAGVVQSTSPPDLGSWISEFLKFYRERFDEVLVLRESGPPPPSLSCTPEFPSSPETPEHPAPAAPCSSKRHA